MPGGRKRESCLLFLHVEQERELEFLLLPEAGWEVESDGGPVPFLPNLHPKGSDEGKAQVSHLFLQGCVVVQDVEEAS